VAPRIAAVALLSDVVRVVAGEAVLADVKYSALGVGLVAGVAASRRSSLEDNQLLLSS